MLYLLVRIYYLSKKKKKETSDDASIPNCPRTASTAVPPLNIHASTPYAPVLHTPPLPLHSLTKNVTEIMTSLGRNSSKTILPLLLSATCRKTFIERAENFCNPVASRHYFVYSFLSCLSTHYACDRPCPLL